MLYLEAFKMVRRPLLTSLILLLFTLSSVAQVFVSEYAIVADKKGAKDYQELKRDITLSLAESSLDIGGKGKQARSLKLDKVDQNQRGGFVVMNFKCVDCKNGEVVQIKMFNKRQTDADGHIYDSTIGIRVIGSRSSELYYALRKDS